MKTLHTDIAVIGAGTAGLAAYRAARAAGKRAVIIEGGPYGTTCARVGCMPSKLLIAAAEAAHAARHTDAFGVRVAGAVSVDGPAVMDRVKRERDRFVGFVLEGVENLPAEDKLHGYARFVSDTVLRVDDHTEVHASRVVIATGSRPAIPAPFLSLGDRLVVNDDVFAWDTLPASVAVFGPGVIGLELGQALARLGVKVRVFGVSGSLGGISDPAVRQAARKIFQGEFYLDPDARVLETQRVGDEVEIRYIALDNTERVERFEYALVATGRRPNVDQLGLENTTLKLDGRGVPHYDRLTMQAGDSAIFIAGDANADAPLLHEAADEGRIAGENAARYPERRPGLRRAPLGVVFSDPQIALVGTPHARLQTGQFVTGAVDFGDQGRSRVMLKNRGMLHVYADIATGRFLGAEMIGPSAEHIGHLLAWAAQQELTIAQMLEMPFYHPVVEEGLRTALRDAAARLAQAGARRAA
ncbi:dihydrolipoyl dehydrogenase [Bordetella pseudohinzii]|uniref:Dihydrolipoyl dehydrogenase n=1 Tax=Bordetella pseudohinzii TaxID=1331258 RepID=A0A0J6C9T9_9BORD|nr:dihydrolipoyl dehydrogenase [Bordetella pseudohinzii]ANY16352.1 dihydrolipoyl dehydrogenase [Bordetella pseudohinzii]KMM27486.1 dihydrolipoamide dehydrogenase [Bordetella pseudohinzii]KXA76671.1 dihydrolipoamide dehydrogenase [Bordetella pseudohinzii]KXA80668.1 dihydrolipoamide dehydrogenase [Bordetella pseudohinzii]CUI39168.1 Dihydrolipoyl dehydrogenase [Bordetella pseudohinzii]